MTTIYFVRHVQAMGNLNRVFQGKTDTDISEDGKKQLQNVQDRFAGVELQHIYVSDLKRARLTAQAVCGGRNIPMSVERRIREIDAGVWEGQPMLELKERYPEAMRLWNEELWNFHTDQSETMRQVYERTGAALRDILSESENQAVAVVSHGCALKNMLCVALGHPIEDLMEMPWLGNGSVTRVDFQHGGPGALVYANDMAHIDQSTILTGIAEFLRGSAAK